MYRPRCITLLGEVLDVAFDRFADPSLAEPIDGVGKNKVALQHDNLLSAHAALKGIVCWRRKLCAHSWLSLSTISSVCSQPAHNREGHRNTTTPSWRWRASSVMANASAPGSSVNCNRTICSAIASGGQARATIRARSRGWSDTRGATSWCRSHTRSTSRNSTHACWSAAGAGGATDCGVTTRRSASGWCGLRGALLPLPPTPYDACEKMAARVSSLSLVRYRGNDYSVPTAYGHREVLIRGYVHEVVIACAAQQIARHRRSYQREDFVFEPLHYLALLEHNIGALDQAAPLVGWGLPAEFATLRRLLEARMSKPGKREFVQVLRLLEVFQFEDVLAGVREAIARGVISFDAVKHLVLCRIERRPPRLNLEVYPYLPHATVATTLAKTYLSLLAGGVS